MAGYSAFLSMTLCSKCFCVLQVKNLLWALHNAVLRFFVNLTWRLASEKGNTTKKIKFFIKMLHNQVKVMCYFLFCIVENTSVQRTTRWWQEKECPYPRILPREETSSSPLRSSFQKSFPLTARAWSSRLWALAMKIRFICYSSLICRLIL